MLFTGEQLRPLLLIYTKYRSVTSGYHSASCNDSLVGDSGARPHNRLAGDCELAIGSDDAAAAELNTLTESL